MGEETHDRHQAGNAKGKENGSIFNICKMVLGQIRSRVYEIEEIWFNGNKEPQECIQKNGCRCFKMKNMENTLFGYLQVFILYKNHMKNS